MQETDEKKTLNLEDKTIKITQSENREKLDWKKMNRASENCGKVTKKIAFILRALEGEEKEGRATNVLEKMTKTS